MTAPSLIAAARRMANSLQKETDCARLGSLSDLAEAAEDKQQALQELTCAYAARGRSPLPTAAERAELRRLLAHADENALILEAVNATLQDLAGKLRGAAAAAADPGTYTLPGRTTKRSGRHVVAACVNASI
jgi:ferric-dicitrate binding protein FerR (iron transport regulator)